MSVRKILARPALHLLLAALLLGVVCSPLLGASTPSASLSWMFGGWTAALVVLAILSRADDRPEEE